MNIQESITSAYNNHVNNISMLKLKLWLIKLCHVSIGTRFKVSSFKLWYVVLSIKINHVLLNLFKIAINRDSYKSLRRTFKSLHLLKSSSKTTKNFNCQSWIKLQGLQKLQRLQSIEVSWTASSEVLKKLSPQIFEDEKRT